MSDTITLTGNVATDPELKRTGNGIAITSFRLASSRRRFDRATGTWVDDGTNWYRVSTYRGLADHAYHSLQKGQRVLLTGRLRVRDWDNGTRQGTDVEIDADAIGHDLLWGTSTFVKDGGSAAPRAETWEVAPLGEQREWSAPGVEPRAASASDSRSESDSAGADAEGPRTLDAEVALTARELVDEGTPF